MASHVSQKIFKTNFSVNPELICSFIRSITLPAVSIEKKIRCYYFKHQCTGMFLLPFRTDVLNEVDGIQTMFHF